MIINFGDSIVDTTKITVIKKDDEYISFRFENCEVISYFLGDKKLVDELYSKIIDSYDNVVNLEVREKKHRGRPRKKAE